MPKTPCRTIGCPALVGRTKLFVTTTPTTGTVGTRANKDVPPTSAAMGRHGINFVNKYWCKMMATILPIKQTLLDVLYFRLNLPKKQVFVKNTCFFIANLHYRVTAPKGGFLLSKKNYERKPSYLYRLIALGVRAGLSTFHTRDGR